MKRISAIFLAFILALSLGITAFAASEADAIIDYTKTGSLTVYKVDSTAATEGGLDLEQYTANGIYDEAIVTELSPYMLQGVEYTYLKVSAVETITTFVDSKGLVRNLYGFGADSADLLAAIGLELSDAEYTSGNLSYFNIATLAKAIDDTMASNSTIAKNALETYIKANGGTAMAETDASGKTVAEDLELGLYLVVETRVPENVVSTTNPFFVSVPSTTADGDEWFYDVCVYPKNQTGNPDLEKTLREDKEDTGKNNGTAGITDGFAHTGTASIGDTVEYQIISTLPAITSAATYLTTYTYVDTLSAGLTYNEDVVIEFFKDAACTEKITTWTLDDQTAKYTVVYGSNANTMTIAMTAAGLAEINDSEAVYPNASSLASGYSTCTMRITYSAEVDSDAVLGDAGNENEVELTWIRTNTSYSDTLDDCCHLYTYGVDLTKEFAINKEAGDFANVKFVVKNTTDGYYVIATLTDGIYYVTGFTANEADATAFIPTAEGKIVIRGLEDDTYTFTETETDDGFMLLEKPITVVITSANSTTSCDNCGTAFVTATATVNNVAVTMTADGASASALAPLKVVNNAQPTLPGTGDAGVWAMCIIGFVAAALAVVALVVGRKKNTEKA